MTETEVSIDIRFSGAGHEAHTGGGSLGAMYGHLRLWLGSGLVIVGGLWLVDRLAPSADVPGVVATWWPVTMVMAGNAGTTLTSFCRAERPPS